LAHNQNDKHRCENKKSNQIKRISIKGYLKGALREEWDGISPEYPKKLIESIPDALKVVTVNGGLQKHY
jgi:hypothetical protein